MYVNKIKLNRQKELHRLRRIPVVNIIRFNANVRNYIVKERKVKKEKVRKRERRKFSV